MIWMMSSFWKDTPSLQQRWLDEVKAIGCRCARTTACVTLTDDLPRRFGFPLLSRACSCCRSLLYVASSSCCEFLSLSSSAAVTFLVSKYFFFQLSRAVKDSRDTLRFLFFIHLPVVDQAGAIVTRAVNEHGGEKMLYKRRLFLSSFLFAHLGSCGVCFETISLFPCGATPASSTPAVSSHLSPASVLPLILLFTGKQRHCSHAMKTNRMSVRAVKVKEVYVFCDEWESGQRCSCGQWRPSVEPDRERRSQRAEVTLLDSGGMWRRQRESLSQLTAIHLPFLQLFRHMV